MAESTGPILAADGTPLKTSLNRALRREKLRALMLIAPLLIFVLVTFIAPIADMLFRSVENAIVNETLPRTVQALRTEDFETGDGPRDAVFDAFYVDMVFAEARKAHTKLGTRLNYEQTGVASMFRKTGRAVGKFNRDLAKDFTKLNEEWKEPETWSRLFADGGSGLPGADATYAAWEDFVEDQGDDPLKEKPWNLLYYALYNDLSQAGEAPGDALLAEAHAAVGTFDPPVSMRDAFVDVNDKWGEADVWSTIQTYAAKYTPGYFLNSVDRQLTSDGIEIRPENERIYVLLFVRTLIMSLVITFSCILLGYPVAWLLANLPMRTANVLMILVLLPFWTSLLVRTSSWKVLLQQQGVINDILVWLRIVGDDARLELINNQTGTIIAMTHILLPFMILPLYSVMKTIPPSYLRAAKSLGATDWTAFWRVYFPQSVPGIGAGSILVFILAIGYYITPELVGGTKGVFISNRIAFHISSSLNWGLAAALGTILLVAVLTLYWAYDKIVGIDNVKLGG